MTFGPVDNMENLTVNHKNAIKTDNYINKIMPRKMVFCGIGLIAFLAFEQKLEKLQYGQLRSVIVLSSFL